MDLVNMDKTIAHSNVKRRLQVRRLLGTHLLPLAQLSLGIIHRHQHLTMQDQIRIRGIMVRAHSPSKTHTKIKDINYMVHLQMYHILIMASSLYI
jgi:hypothetical protein